MRRPTHAHFQMPPIGPTSMQMETTPVQTSATDGSSWCFPPAMPIGQGLLAWELLGDGRRCETWLAWCSARWSPVVVKLPKPDHLEDPEREAAARTALAREASTASSLAHPGIQRLLEARLEQPVPCLVFEYVEGPTLADLLAEEGALLPSDVIRLGMQLAASLHYLHGRGFVHLDVKPGNVGLADGRAILMDFDVALPEGAVRSESKPRGTAAYMAPEQIRCEPAAPSMDLFALGATLFEAATSTPAFRPTGEWPDRVYPQLFSPAPSARDVDPGTPRDLNRVLRTLMALDARSRPATARAALRLLEAARAVGEEGLWPEWVHP